MRTWKQIQNMLVVSLKEGSIIGRLDDLQFSLDDHKIYGWRLKGQGVFGKSSGISADQVERLGADVVLVSTNAAVEEGTGGDVEGRGWAGSYRGTPALTRRGESLGDVADYVLDEDGGRLSGLVVQDGRLLLLEGKVHLGPSAVIVEDEAAILEPPKGETPEEIGWWSRIKGSLGSSENKDDDKPDPSDTTDGW